MTITTVGYEANPKVGYLETKIFFLFFMIRVYRANSLAAFVPSLESLQSPFLYQ